MNRYIGLDLGTSAVKGVALAIDGVVTKTARRSLPLVFPHPGWVEFEPAQYLSAIYEVIAELVAGDGQTVRAVGISGASGNTVLLDDQFQPLTRFISWLDERAVGKPPAFFGGIDVDEIHQITGWYWANGMFPMGHLSWWRNECAKEYTSAANIMMNNDYLTWSLTGVRGMDPSSATPFYLQRQVDQKWHRPYVEAMGIEESLLSPILSSGSVLGGTLSTACEATGLAVGTPIVLGSFDHPSAARASGVAAPGDVLLSCGTSWVGFYPIVDRDLAIDCGLLVDPFNQPYGPWGAMFSLPGYGTVVDRVVNELFGGNHAAFDDAAFHGSAAQRGIVLDPSTSPLDGADTFIEVLASMEKQTAAKATMEYVAFLMREKINELELRGVLAHHVSMVGGPARRPVWPVIVANVLRKPVTRGHGVWAGAVGAAMSAIGGTEGVAEAQNVGLLVSRTSETVEPDTSLQSMYDTEYSRFIDMKNGA